MSHHKLTYLLIPYFIYYNYYLLLLLYLLFIIFSYLLILLFFLVLSVKVHFINRKPNIASQNH